MRWARIFGGDALRILLTVFRYGGGNGGFELWDRWINLHCWCWFGLVLAMLVEPAKRVRALHRPTLEHNFLLNSIFENYLLILSVYRFTWLRRQHSNGDANPLRNYPNLSITSDSRNLWQDFSPSYCNVLVHIYSSGFKIIDIIHTYYKVRLHMLLLEAAGPSSNNLGTFFLLIHFFIYLFFFEKYQLPIF